LKSLQFDRDNVKAVIVWAGKTTLSKLPPRNNIMLVHEKTLDKNLIYRLFWQRFILPKRLKNRLCDILFSPGGSVSCNFSPSVTMSRNMLPFENRQLKYKNNKLRLFLLRRLQLRSFKHATGIIFLSKYAKNTIFPLIRKDQLKNLEIIPHGVHKRFSCERKVQKPIACYSETNPLQLLYVSHCHQYKNQINLLNAAAKLFKVGYPVSIKFIGGGSQHSINELRSAIEKEDPAGKFASYLGEVSHDELPRFYQDADVFVYASSCENFPNILMEAVCAKLPVICSNKSVMPEVMGNAADYFDPSDPNDIYNTLLRCIHSTTKRESLIDNLSAVYQQTWSECAMKTFAFLYRCYQKN
jgi:glycosyltransferase involved in cell wall biosynthesis